MIKYLCFYCEFRGGGFRSGAPLVWSNLELADALSDAQWDRYVGPKQANGED